MAKKTLVITGEDTTVLPQSIDKATDSYLGGQPRVSDLVKQYGGKPGKLARDIAGISQSEPLPKKGTDERRAYENAKRNINRWEKAEKGGKGQTRRPDTTSQEKLKSAAMKKRPPSAAFINMEGYIYYDNDIRWRHIKVSLSNSQVVKVLEHVEAKDVHAAYGEIFAAYGAARLEIAAEGPPIIDITFS